jgi:hypothetical protein
MQGSMAAADGAYALGAATWPLLAGLTLVLWSKARAWRAAVRVRAR